MAREDEPEPADLAREREREWQDIVENFGERAVLDPADEPVSDDALSPPDPGNRSDPVEAVDPVDAVDPADEFVPPTPPPVPRPPVDRLLAWTGVFGVPAVVLFCIVVGATLPSWVGVLFAACFIGGSGYLVVSMPDEPRDPWDDGAVL